MGTWRYTAIDRAGRSITGTLDAADEAEVARLLRRQGAVPVQLATVRARRTWTLESGGAEVLTRKEQTAFLRELATMLGAGQDLDRALSFLVDTAAAARTRRITTALRDAVRGGAALAAAMALQPRSFPRLTIGLVRAGEAGGTLAPTLERLATLMERERSLAATVQSALIYPALLLVAAIGAIALLLTQVLPQFVPLFEQNGAQLPDSTRFLIAAGDAVAAYGPATLLGLALLLVIACQLLRRPAPRLAFDRLRLHLPVLGTLGREVMAARLCRTLGTLLQNGVALVPALAIAREVLGNEAGTAGLDRATLAARGGAGLAGPLEQAGLFPPRTIHLLRLGEETAQLGTMALRAAEIHEEQVRLATQRLVSLLTPAITIVMGAVIAGIVSSLLLAMLSLNDLAQ
ncbi:General secretion pathway protein F / Type II secretory pathway, component PulF [Rhodovastum atsumiense]|uniref:Type II secretion system F family protein n=1 Tax=Rhodovastum atsumiense TaxID=504468 RepID=A0A5M6IPD6_9PROT|nr:type II secretion system F family protein [Rhodovastum atsumiense]KAA5609428.1 type II secretion system F family protein [Rhodovastum atsumiense]CAH2601848.1 General secretion pathway protein F / Type II secretory pathway, component PulF [Rhodovastum atsumiense]